MKTIKLTDGSETIVDDEDYDWLSQFNWGHQTIWNSGGYARRWGSNGKKKTNLLMHRLIVDCPADKQVDHINHNTLDNRKCNLRIVSKYQNMANALKTTKPKTSKFKGVCWCKAYKKWAVEIVRNGTNHHLGYFDTESKAAEAYNKKALELSAEHSHLNAVPA